MVSLGVVSKSFSRQAYLKRRALQEFPDCEFLESETTDEKDLIQFLKDKTHAIVGREKVTRSLLSSLPKLEVISKYGVGLDNLDLGAMAEQGVRLGWTPGVNKRSVAELTLWMMIDLFRRTSHYSRSLKGGEWNRIESYNLSGKRVGLIGCGQVGKEVVRLLKPFECELVIHDIRSYPDFYREFNLREVSLSALLEESDLVSLHVPLNESTRNLIGVDEISKMKPGSFLVNNSRGGIVDEHALVVALESAQLAGAAFDVFEEEPSPNRKLIQHRNFIGTPHTGGSSIEAVKAMGESALSNLTEAMPAESFVEFL